MLEKALESPLGYKEIKLVNPKENQPSISLEGLILKVTGDEGSRGSDGSIASLTQTK